MKLARTLLSGLLIFALTLLHGVGVAVAMPNVGTVVEASMFAYGTPPGGERAIKEASHGIVQNETLETGLFSSLAAKLKDGTLLTLSANSKLTVDEYVYDPKGRQAAVYNLVEGVFYYATGKMHKDAIIINTPSATIGIRGTELVINVDRTGRTRVGVVSGAVSVRGRKDNSGWNAERGNTISIGAEGRVEGVSKGVDKTGDEDIDREIPDDLAKLGKAEDGEEDSPMAQFQREREEDNRKKHANEEGQDGEGDGEGRDGKKRDSGEDRGEGDSGDEGEGRDRGDYESELDSSAEASDRSSEGDHGDSESSSGGDGGEADVGDRSDGESEGNSGGGGESRSSDRDGGDSDGRD